MSRAGGTGSRSEGGDEADVPACGSLARGLETEAGGWDLKPEEQAWALAVPVGRTRPGIAEPGGENSARYWVWLPGKRPGVPLPLPPRARLGAPCWVRLGVGPVSPEPGYEFSTVK